MGSVPTGPTPSASSAADPTVPRPAALWDFTRPDDLLAERSGTGLTLKPGLGPEPRWTSDPSTGGALRFPGQGSHLVLPASEATPLSMAGPNAVSVMALVRRNDLGTGFVAGLWQEDDRDPRRQYGLFLDLPTYGGAEQVIGHVSATGGPSPGLPYSRDYAATARMVRPHTWRVVGFTYDGALATAFLDGLADPRPRFTEQGPPLGQSRTYAKNPYSWPDGLNPSTLSDFTVGAVQLTRGIGNCLRGDIARLAVWDRALTAEQVMAQAHAWTPPGHPLVRFDWWRPSSSLPCELGGWDGQTWPVETNGWSLIEGAADSVGVLPGGLVKPLTDSPVSIRVETPGMTDHMARWLTVSGASPGLEVGIHYAASTSESHVLKGPETISWKIHIGSDPSGPARPIHAIELRFPTDWAGRIGEIAIWSGPPTL